MAEWHRLGDAYYRRQLLYELSWPIKRLDEHLVVASRDGGLLGTRVH